MLTMVLICFAVILLVIAGMAVGVMHGREPIKGSCGGLNKLGLRDGPCPVCGDDPAQCDQNRPQADGAGLGRDAMR